MISCFWHYHLWSQKCLRYICVPLSISGWAVNQTEALNGTLQKLWGLFFMILKFQNPSAHDLKLEGVNWTSSNILHSYLRQLGSRLQSITKRNQFKFTCIKILLWSFPYTSFFGIKGQPGAIKLPQCAGFREVLDPLSGSIVGSFTSHSQEVDSTTRTCGITLQHLVLWNV